MEFSEKIKKLRKQHNLTQEELAEKLFISRTAISKWESGKGYPSIDLLKQISEYFNVSLDRLLSSEQILELAEIDKQQKLKRLKNYLFAIFDCMILFLIFLPLYSKRVDNYIFAVPLLSNNDLLSYIKIIYLVSYFIIFFLGMIEMIMCFLDKYKLQNWIHLFSLSFQFIVVLFLIMTREPYACSFVFILFMMKLILFVIREKKDS